MPVNYPMPQHPIVTTIKRLVKVHNEVLKYDWTQIKHGDELRAASKEVITALQHIQQALREKHGV